jgi:protein-disulfide isomerase
MKRQSLFIAAAVVLIAAFAIGSFVYMGQKADSARALANQALLMRAHAPTEGPRAAKVNIVEFLDPACGTCREFYPFVHKLMAAHPDKIRLTVRYAPLHPNSDQVVKILEAARTQGKWKEALETLFATQAAWAPNHTPQPELAWRQVAGIGLDLERARQDANSPEIARRVTQDIADGKALNVKATPEFFVNGKPMPSFGYQQLTDLVNEALATAYR